MARKILLVVVEVGAARSRCQALHTGLRDPKEGGSDEFQDHATDIDAQESLFKLRTTFTVHRRRRPLVHPSYIVGLWFFLRRHASQVWKIPTTATLPT